MTKSFYKEFDSHREARTYADRQHQLLTEYEGLEWACVNGYSISYYRNQELVTILVLENIM